MKYIVVLPAAGSGKRMKAGHNKLFLTLRGKPILIHTLDVFEQDSDCIGIWLAVKPEERVIIQEMLKQYNVTKVKGMPAGGAERQHSVYACVKEASNEAELILVHDAARPFIEPTVIKQLTQKDTMKRVHNHIIEETVDREQLWIIQTPQAFHTSILTNAQHQAEQDGFLGTDESMLVERLNIDVHVVESTYDNVKMTTQEDLLIGEAILQKRQQEEN
jgi:2-C-methyl-D-erythritol 4-phosphate cytidylyltransferase